MDNKKISAKKLIAMLNKESNSNLMRNIKTLVRLFNDNDINLSTELKLIKKTLSVPKIVNGNDFLIFADAIKDRFPFIEINGERVYFDWSIESESAIKLDGGLIKISFGKEPQKIEKDILTNKIIKKVSKKVEVIGMDGNTYTAVIIEDVESTMYACRRDKFPMSFIISAAADLFKCKQAKEKSEKTA